MKKEDFIEGKWYFNSKWEVQNIAKFKGIVKNTGGFVSSERIQEGKFITSEATLLTNNDYSGFRLATDGELIKYLPTGHTDIPEQELKLQNFPKVGYCEFDGELFYELNKKEFKNKGTAYTNAKFIVWNKQFDDLYTCSEDKYLKALNFYTKNQLSTFINKKDEIPRQKTTDSRSNRGTTITIRRRRQQITVGSRPEGNQTSNHIRKTRVRSIEIASKAVIKGYCGEDGSN